MSIDQIKARIRKLLNLARDGGASEGEVENAMKFAQQLMDEYHLSEADCAPEDLSYGQHGVYCQSNLTPWEQALAWAIVKTVGSVGWLTEGRKRVFDDERNAYATKTKITFYGPSQDLSLVIEMWNTMRFTIMTMAYAKHGAVYRGAGRSYCMGFANALYDMAKAHEQKDRSNECTAIVLKKSELAKQWFEKERGTKLRNYKTATYGARHDDAYVDGYADGEQNPLSGVKHKVTSGGRKLLT